MSGRQDGQPALRWRLVWFVALWACGVGTVALLSLAIRWLLR